MIYPNIESMGPNQDMKYENSPAKRLMSEEISFDPDEGKPSL